MVPGGTGAVGSNANLAPVELLDRAACSPSLPCRPFREREGSVA